MDAIPSFSIDPALDTPEGGVRAHLFGFREAKIGVGHPSLDDLRNRVLDRARAVGQRYPDLTEAPRLQELARLVYAAGVSPWQWPPIPASHVQAILRGDPFPVVNDAVDLARLFGLTEFLPTFALDPGKLRAPLSLGLADESLPSLRGEGPENLLGLPVIKEPERALFSLCHELLRPEVSELSKSIVVIVLEPWPAPAPFDREAGRRRLENWFGELTRAKLARVATIGGPRSA